MLISPSDERLVQYAQKRCGKEGQEIIFNLPHTRSSIGGFISGLPLGQNPIPSFEQDAEWILA